MTVIINFDASSPNWTDDMDYNEDFLEHRVTYINKLLESRRSCGMFINEICDELGIPRKKNYVEYGVKKKFEPRLSRYWLIDDDVYEAITIEFNAESLIERFGELI